MIDLYTRQIVGWAMERMTKELVSHALRMAWFRRRPHPGLIHHSDRGSQYCSHAFRSSSPLTDAAVDEPQGQLLGHSVYDGLERPAQSDSCWDWPTCLGVDLSTAVRRSPSIAGPRVCDLIGALFCTVSVLSCERVGNASPRMQEGRDERSD